MRKRERATRWLLIIAAALVFHVVLLLCVKPSVFEFFARTPAPPPSGHSVGAQMPDAILSIPVEFEDDGRQRPAEPGGGDVELQDPDNPTGRPGTSEPGYSPGSDRDMLQMAGEASRTLPQGPNPDLLQTPPRPVQITWPDTRPPEYCLGHEITVLIQVDEGGRIQRVEPEAASHPPDCVRAAVETARLIVFAPGTVNGRPVKMWTRIRIDFGQQPGR